ncbi:MAG: DUF1223 domain-containing protein [Mesorhizobium amorphae]|nr:MAG: DUF1223 domain-containing protein [Mesorhizobium amorphae]
MFGLRQALAASLVCLGLVAPASAGSEAPRRIASVVELFTSQGCNSCPPADAVLAELGGTRPDLLALAFHVDYWDYLGWHDSFATPDHTQRQKSYAQAFGKRMVYTPQLVINGRVQMNGAKRDKILRALKEMSNAGAGLSVVLGVEASPEGATVVVPGAEENATTMPRARLLLVLFKAPADLPIRGGENEGHTILYWNPVTEVREIARWDGTPARVSVSWMGIDAKQGAAALLQETDSKGMPRAVLGAAVLREPAR